MMNRTYETNINDFGKVTIPIGRVGENNYREISVDCSAWLEDYPGGSLSLIFRRADGSVYLPMGVSIASGVLTWIPSDVDVNIVGIGAAQIQLSENDVIALSSIAPIQVCDGLTDVSDVPTPEESWLEEMIAASVTARDAANEASNDADRAETAATNAENSETRSEDAATRSENAAGRAEQAESDVEHGLAAKADKTYVDDQLATKLDAANGNATGTLDVINEIAHGRIVIINTAGNGGMFRGYTTNTTKGLMLRALEEGDNPNSSSAGVEIANFHKNGFLFLVRLSMNGNQIKNLAAPTANNDATNKKYIDDIRAALETLIGGKITNGGTPNSPKVKSGGYAQTATLSDATEGAFVRVFQGDTITPSFVSIKSASGKININACRLNNVADPTGANDAATKQYVDDQIAALRTELGL